MYFNIFALLLSFFSVGDAEKDNIDQQTVLLEVIHKLGGGRGWPLVLHYGTEDQ